jgi:hypothetical protein
MLARLHIRAPPLAAQRRHWRVIAARIRAQC